MMLLSRIQQALETAGVMCLRSKGALSLPEYSGVLETETTALAVRCHSRSVRYACVATTTEALLTVTGWQLDDGRRARPKRLRLVQ